MREASHPLPPVQSAAPAISLPPAAEPVAAIVPTAAADFGQPTAPTELAELESLSTLTKDSIPATSGLTPTVAIVPPSFDPLFEHTASPLHSILEPVPTSFLESSAADLAAASDDGDTGSSDSEDDSDVDELFSFLSSKTSSPSVSADSITVAPSFADSEEATASVFSVARNGAGRLWSKSSSSSSAISSTSTANDAAAAGPSSSPLRRSTSSSTVKESAEAAQSTELKTTTSTASLTAPASPVDRFPRARDSNSSPPPTRLKPILRRESCPENLDLLGQTGEEYRHGLTRNASQPHLHRSDSAKSLSFREKLEQICLFSSGDSPSQLALVPQTEFFVGSDSDETDSETDSSRSSSSRVEVSP
ncbi:hypothetical protein DFJ73DRAFT_86781 [Zopfochytrium polystomum]|nr:hypothetical protein DFJ73DRAFT_86781 [Zopfochytrium polystomum]